MDEKPERRILPQGSEAVYICNECQAEQQVRPTDAIRCRRCGHRILLKRRDRKLMVYDAR